MTETPKLSQALDGLDILLAELDGDDRVGVIFDEFLRAYNAGELPENRLVTEVAEAMLRGDIVQERRLPGAPKHGHAIENRNFNLAVSVHGLLQRKSITKRSAFTEVARNNGLKSEVVRKAYYAQRSEAEAFWQKNQPIFDKILRNAANWDGVMRNAQRNAAIFQSITERALKQPKKYGDN